MRKSILFQVPQLYLTHLKYCLLHKITVYLQQFHTYFCCITLCFSLSAELFAVLFALIKLNMNLLHPSSQSALCLLHINKTRKSIINTQQIPHIPLNAINLFHPLLCYFQVYVNFIIFSTLKRLLNNNFKV
jgi:hypothetical protein